MEFSSEADIPHPPLPAELPVMVLPDCHLFPGCLLPLYIFEERYCEMLAHALNTDRMFCIGNREGGGEDCSISPYSTAGLVRVCVKQEEGTSHLLLLGIERIRLKGWTQLTPFRIAEVEAITTVISDAEKISSLRLKALELFADGGISEYGKQLREALSCNENAELVCDVLSYHFTRCPKLQQKLLGEESLERRYEMLIEALERAKCK